MTLTLLAPFAGWSAPLAQIPDAVFAQGMVGDGLCIDPTSSQLRAPCDAEVISIAAARHAVALRAANGAEILLHVGIDTVALAGEGFTLHVRNGERVRAGDLLLSFDLDALARVAKSLVTPLVITNSDRFRILRAQVNCAVDSGQPLLDLEPVAVSGEESTSAKTPVVSEVVVVQHAHGIHARPAALIAKLAKSLPCELQLRARGRGASARSAVALMALGVRGGDELVIAGFEPAAADGVAAIAKLVRGLAHTAPPAVAIPAPRPDMPRRIEDPSRIAGVVASHGVAVGGVFHLSSVELAVAEVGAGLARESESFERARAALHARLAQLARTAAPALRDIMAAHLELLDDPLLLDATRALMAQGKSAGFAWRASLRASGADLLATGDARLAERVDDLLDLERQLLRELSGKAAAVAGFPAGGILLARDLTPSQLIDLDMTRLGGIALAAGGPTSHVAILAAAQGVPMLVAAGSALLEIRPGTTVVLDAESGCLDASPTPAELDSTRRELQRRQERRASEQAAARHDCHLVSGERIEVLANLTGTPVDATQALEQGAEGCGLLRTEFLFLERETAPDVAEQLRCYREVAAILGHRPLVIRTLDIGGDKPIPYLPLPPEDNPALGLRGIRTSLWRPDLLDVQLRALLRVGAGQLRILLPMITDVEEIRFVRQRLEKLGADLGTPLPQLGAMIETPAAAMLAGPLSREVDFLSLGTNDLAQYTLAMDRGHAELASRIDGLHPAVLALIARTCDAAAGQHKPVAVCGGLASDVAAIPVLLGLGVRELSVVPAQIPRLKALIGTLTLDACRELAQHALVLETASQVRALVRQALP